MAKKISRLINRASCIVHRALINRALCIVHCALISASCIASEPLRPVSSTYTVEIGSAHIADTYLSPMHYSGIHAGLSYSRLQAMRFDPERWVMQLRLGASVDFTKNPAKTITLYNAGIDASWGMMRRWTLPAGFSAGIGPALDIDAGVLYIDRSGNNPASARAAVTVDASAFAQWRGSLLGIPLTARYSAMLPVGGVFFSPDYGELYYQIYLGYRYGLVHPAWWGSYFSLDNRASVDLHFGGTSLRLAYHNYILSTKASNLVTRNVTHALSIGITTDWISLRPGSDAVKASRIISAY